MAGSKQSQGNKSKKPAHDWKAEQRKFTTWKVKHPTGTLREYCQKNRIKYETARHHIKVNVAAQKIAYTEQRHIQKYQEEFESRIRKMAREHGDAFRDHIGWIVNEITRVLSPKHQTKKAPEIKSWDDMEKAVRTVERLLDLVEKLEAVGGGGERRPGLSEESIQTIEGLLGFKFVFTDGSAVHGSRDPRFQGQVIDADD